ncbi:hypothetical protein [Shewanella colwelliana]|uniref:hypothetical protein n=1 Tax=Shewanella colwelliana TaxID=23 RepID=UPI000687527B|nr:hypothetical protein [Shewanella colwelliana]
MANKQKGMSTLMLLVLFLMLVSTVVTGSLYLDMRHKNRLLLSEIEQLKKTQVLLMVPDEQAKAVAEWMASNPDATKSLLSQAKPGEQTSVEIGPGVTSTEQSKSEALNVRDSPSLLIYPAPDMQSNKPVTVLTDDIELIDAASTTTDNNMLGSKTDVNPDQVDNLTSSQPVKLSENQDGVKVISLPHGGIRVTTREDN